MENLKSNGEYKTTVTQPSITAEELKSKLDSNEPLMVLDISITAEELKVSWYRIWNLIKRASGF